MGHRYHINGKGEAGLCRATKACPFGDFETEHYGTAADARFAFEAKHSAALFKPRDLKKLTHDELVDAILTESELTGEELRKLSHSIQLAEVLHEGQVRKALIQGRANTPYIEHPLRNTLRLIRLGVRDHEVLIANVLHDTVEDCSQRYTEVYTPLGKHCPEPEAREYLLTHIAVTYSPRTADLVEGVTNPYVTKEDWAKLSQQEKHDDYRSHVKPAIMSDPDVFLIKFSDFKDNAGSLHHSTPAERRGARRRATKYHPLVPDFQEAYAHHKPRLQVTPEAHLEIEQSLVRMDQRLQKIIAEVH